MANEQICMYNFHSFHNLNQILFVWTRFHFPKCHLTLSKPFNNIWVNKKKIDNSTPQKFRNSNPTRLRWDPAQICCSRCKTSKTEKGSCQWTHNSYSYKVSNHHASQTKSRSRTRWEHQKAWPPTKLLPNNLICFRLLLNLFHGLIDNLIS